MRTLALGTRGSPLALAQARFVADLLRRHHGDLAVDLVIIRTHGDEDGSADQGPGIGDRRSGPSSLIPGSGKALFTQRIEEALEAGRIDAAVHSLKDLAAISATPGSAKLIVGAVPAREDPRDALVAKPPRRFRDLPTGAVIGTGSLRRAAQLRHARPDLHIEPLRGNVGTRLRKLQENSLSGIVVAAAGLRRLGLADVITEVFDPDFVLPAPGQGALAVQVRSDSLEVLRTVRAVENADARACVEAERSFSHRLGADCNVAVGALARREGEDLILEGCVADPRGTHIIRDRLSGPASAAAELGRRLAERVLAQGGQELLEAPAT